MSKQQATLSKQRSTLSKQHSTLLLKTATMSNDSIVKFRHFDKVETNGTCSVCFDIVERINFVRHCCRNRQHCCRKRHLWDRHLKSAHSRWWMGGISTPSNTWFFEPTRVSIPNGISIDSAVFAGLTNVSNTQTDPTTLRRV